MAPEIELQDRSPEREALDQLIAGARAGRSAAMVLRGEPGVGKTALLDYLLSHASGCRIARAAGVESEMELAYAGLHQLCAPFLDRLDRLPEPQRDALGTAFGLRSSDPPDRFLVGLAVLSLLSDVAEKEPLVCLLDDAQWLDRASRQVLGFVGRRLAEEGVILVFAMRASADDRDLAGVSELDLGPLPDVDARALLASAIPGRVDDSVRDRIVVEARGNPLALLELPRAWTLSTFAGGFGLPDSASVSDRIEESFRLRLLRLPEQSQRLLLIAAAEPVGDAKLVLAAAERLGIPADASGPAMAAGLFDTRTQFGFRHPMVRSVVYRESAIGDRRAVHAALAEATDATVDPDRRAWHLAAASAGADDEVASALEHSAARAQARGGVAAAAAFLQRAAALTPDPHQRLERTLAAAQASLRAGSLDDVLGLLAGVERGQPDLVQRARVDLLRAHVAFASGYGPDAPPLLLKAARRIQAFDTELARETYLNAWVAAVLAGHDAEPHDLEQICRDILALRPRPGEPRPLDLLLEGLALLMTAGHAVAAAMLRRAAKALIGIPVEDVLRWGWVANAAADTTWDFEGSRAMAERLTTIFREVGALGQLPMSLSALGNVALWSGDFAGAASIAAEVASVATATGSNFPRSLEVRLLCLQGNERDAMASIAEARADAGRGGQGIAAISADWAAAILHNGLGRYNEALAAADRATSVPVEPFISTWALPELVEAAARAGQDGRAQDALERLIETTQPSGTDFALAVEARCRAIVSDGAAAEDHYRGAIDRLRLTPLRPELARAHLLHGEWLRRDGRRVDARDQLRTSYNLFVSMGMAAFAERARRELLATGERVRKRRAETVEQLTPQEEQIARLARDGFSNGQISAQLFLSPRTVEWHLHKVFAKLGISSRRELHGLPAEADRTAFG